MQNIDLLRDYRRKRGGVKVKFIKEGNRRIYHATTCNLSQHYVCIQEEV